MEKVDKIWMDGELVNWDDAKVHVLTHGLHYGSGVFEGVRCYETPKGPAIFRLQEHTDRLFDSAHVLGLEIPFSKDDINQATKDVISKNNLKSGYIRPLVTLGYGQMGLNPVGCPVSCSIAAWPWGAYLGDEGIKNGISVRTSSFTRHHVNVGMTKAKITGNYANSILAKREAVEDGYDEAIMLDTEGYVAECTGENIFVVKNGVLFTPPDSSSILPGITRNTIMTLAKDLGYEVRETKLTRDTVYMADELFLTGTAAELTPVREMDKRKIGEGKPGPVTKKLQEFYSAVLTGKEEKYSNWLTLC